MGMELTGAVGSQSTNVCGHYCAWLALTYFASQIVATIKNLNFRDSYSWSWVACSWF